MTTNRKRNSWLVTLLGLAAVTLFAACTGDSSPPPAGGAGGSGTSPTGGAGGTSASTTGSGALFEFTSGAQGWVYNTYQLIGDGGAPTAPYNLASTQYTTTATRPTIGWDGTVGNPGGSLKLVINFTAFQQNVLANVQFSPAKNWANKIVTMQMKLETGFEGMTTGGMQVYAQDESWAGTYQWKTWPADTDWHPYELDMTSAGSMLTDDVKQFGVQINSGDPPTDPSVSQTFTPTTVTLHIDTIVVP